MKISIVTAVWNREDTVSNAMKSVQSQSWQNREHIIQDGGSTDGTLEIIESLADDRTHIVSERDRGIYDAINRGIARATGDIVGLMHSDDFFAHDRVLELVAEAFQDAEVDGVFGDLQYVSASNTARVIRHWRAGAYEPRRLRAGWMPPHPTLYLRRQVFDRWGLYDAELQIAADYEAMLRYLIRGGIHLAYIPEVLVKMRTGGESNRSLGRILRKSREDFQAIRRNGAGGVGTLVLKNLSKFGQMRWRGGQGG